MNFRTIGIVIGREYATRVKKKSFLLITFLSPILFAALCVLPSLIMIGAKEEGKQDHERMKNNVMEEVKRIFKPEFLNRIDETIVFRALNKEDMKQIITIMVHELQQRCKDQLQIELTVRDAAKAHIVEEAYDRKYGASPLPPRRPPRQRPSRKKRRSLNPVKPRISPSPLTAE